MGVDWGSLGRAVLGGGIAADDSKRSRMQELLAAEQFRREQERKARDDQMEARYKRGEFRLKAAEAGAIDPDSLLSEEDDPSPPARVSPTTTVAGDAATMPAPRAPILDYNQSREGRRVKADREYKKGEADREVAEATAVIMSMPDPDTGQPYTEAKAKAFGMAGRSGIAQAAGANRDPNSATARAERTQERRDLMTFGAGLRQQGSNADGGSGVSWQIVQTDEGTFERNPKTGETRVLNYPDGTPMKPKMSDSIKTKVAANRQASVNITNALGELSTNGQAVGGRRGWIDAIDQRVDPKGVNARALIANIGSLIIHDRSGAAVTISEAPRLKPFIPSINDRPETIVKKLRQLREAVDSENGFVTEPGRGPMPAAAPTQRGPMPRTAAQKARAAGDPAYDAFLKSKGQ